MDGLTTAAIRDAVVSRLQASSAVTAVVDSANIFESRTLPLPESSAVAAIVVYIHSERMDWAGSGALGLMDLPTVTVSSEVAIECYLSGATDQALEEALDLDGTVITALLADKTFTRMFDQITSVSTDRATDAKGNRRFGVSRITLSLRHRRAWG